MVKILRDAGLSELIESEPLTTLAGGFQFTEGPLWCPDGSILFQDIRAERTYRVRPGGVVNLVRDRTGAANGQTYAAGGRGRIIFCEQNGRRISGMNGDGGGVETLAETWSGQRLNSPNDIVSRSDGLVYFTDPPYGVEPSKRALHFQGVYSLDLRSSPDGPVDPRLLIDDFEKPNGLALSPDERVLYVCDTARYEVRAFTLDPSGAVVQGGGRRIIHFDPGEPGGPDGIKVDREGRLYVAVALGIWVLEPDGRLLGILATPKRPSNLAWCDHDARGLVITAVDEVHHIRLKTAGILPPFTPFPMMG